MQSPISFFAKGRREVERVGGKRSTEVNQRVAWREWRENILGLGDRPSVDIFQGVKSKESIL